MSRLTLICFTAATALALSGCGGGGGATDAVSTPSPTQPAPAPTPAPAPSPNPSPAPTPAPAPAPAPVVWKPTWADVATAKLRPGSRIKPSECTAGFLYVDPVKQVYYLGTAAHCTRSADGTTLDGTGTRVVLDDPETGGDFGEIGTVVYDSDGPIPAPTGIDDPSGGVDFSLIQLDVGINLIANPQEVSLQGPTGYLSCADLVAGDSVAFYGHGTVFSTTGLLMSRVGAVVRCNPFETSAEIGIPVYGGDSGGPLLHQASGKAIGHCSASLAGLPTYMLAPTMDYVFSELVAAGFGNVALATIDGGYVKPE